MIIPFHCHFFVKRGLLISDLDYFLLMKSQTIRYEQMSLLQTKCTTNFTHPHIYDPVCSRYFWYSSTHTHTHTHTHGIKI